jgi:predicted dinucleotide-utilizing enzyme
MPLRKINISGPLSFFSQIESQRVEIRCIEESVHSIGISKLFGKVSISVLFLVVNKPKAGE